MVTKKIIPGRVAGPDEIIQDRALLPDAEDFDYSYVGQSDIGDALSKYKVAGLVLLVAAGIGGGFFVSSLLPGVENSIQTPTSSVPPVVANAEITTPAATASPIRIPVNVPRPPDLTGNLPDGWQDVVDIE